jgi:hypothetical protein
MPPDGLYNCPADFLLLCENQGGNPMRLDFTDARIYL